MWWHTHAHTKSDESAKSKCFPPMCILAGWRDVVVCRLLKVPATCVSGTDLLRLLSVLPHWDRRCRSILLCHTVTLYWHRALILWCQAPGRVAITPSALDKPSIMKRYHRRRTTRWCVTARSPTMVTLHDARFVECRWWNDGWTVKTVVTWRSSAFMIPVPEPVLVWLDTDCCWPRRVNYRSPFSSTIVSVRLSVQWRSDLSSFRKFLKPLSTSALPSCWPAAMSAVLTSLFVYFYAWGDAWCNG